MKDEMTNEQPTKPNPRPPFHAIRDPDGNLLEVYAEI
jgi:hypothetical protein